MSKVLDRASAIFAVKPDETPAGEKLSAALGAEHAAHSRAIRAEANRYSDALNGIVDAAEIRADEVITALLALEREKAQLDFVQKSAASAIEDLGAELGG